jgi:hypothetical protein
VPCGIVDGGVTSMERVLGRTVAREEVEGAYLARFAEVFARSVEVAGSAATGASGARS